MSVDHDSDGYNFFATWMVNARILRTARHLLNDGSVIIRQVDGFHLAHTHLRFTVRT